MCISSVDSNYNTAYIYGQDGQRSNKYTANSETLYFNKMWTLHTDSGNNVYGGQSAKNIYLGETRIVTKLNSGTNPTYQEEYYKQYFYHSDHLGSASLISDYKGDEYQRIEYTPYGETWVEKTSNTGLEYLPYKFTAKELDEETGLYYYGARYLDPKYSHWMSTDPALGEYIPKAPISDEAKKHNQNLSGMGGLFNTVNMNLYHYAGNNPVKYTDPDGNQSMYLPGGGTRFGGAPPNMKYDMKEYAEKSDTIGNVVENCFSAKSADGLVLFCSKFFGNDEFSKQYELYVVKSAIDFHQTMAETKFSGIFDADGDGKYSDDESKSFANYVNNTMTLNYSDKKKLGPLGKYAKVPKLSLSDAKKYLNGISLPINQKMGNAQELKIPELPKENQNENK